MKAMKKPKEEELKPKAEAKDKAADKKKGIKENSKQDLKMDSPNMMQLRTAVMGRKRGKK